VDWLLGFFTDVEAMAVAEDGMPHESSDLEETLGAQ
jgi:hypothetical protein